MTVINTDPGKKCIKILAAVLVICLVASSSGGVADAKKKAKAKGSKAASSKTTKIHEIKISNINPENEIKKGEKVKLKVTYKKAPLNVRLFVWKSSKNSVAKVSQGGVLKARKNGKCKITCALKSNKKIKANLRITVCKPVKNIRTEQLAMVMEPGEKRIITASVSPEDASYDSLKWKSSNPKVAAIDKNGKVKAGKIGKAMVTIKTTGLSKGEKKIDVLVTNRKKLKKVKYISHRGVNTLAPENTAAAFELAGQQGFFGAEGDVWETKHDSKGNFELILNHDDTFDRMTDCIGPVKDFTAEEAEDIRVIKGPNADKYDEKVCTLDTFLDICMKYDMAPIVEIKDSKLTDKGAEKIVDGLYERDLLKKACITSLKIKPLKKIIAYAKTAYEIKPETCYMIFGRLTSKTVTKKIKLAKKNKFTGVWMKSIYISSQYYNLIRKYRLKCDLGPFDKTKKRSELLKFAQFALKPRLFYYDGLPDEMPEVLPDSTPKTLE